MGTLPVTAAMLQHLVDVEAEAEAVALEAMEVAVQGLRVLVTTVARPAMYRRTARTLVTAPATAVGILAILPATALTRLMTSPALMTASAIIAGRSAISPGIAAREMRRMPATGVVSVITGPVTAPRVAPAMVVIVAAVTTLMCAAITATRWATLPSTAARRPECPHHTSTPCQAQRGAQRFN